MYAEPLTRKAKMIKAPRAEDTSSRDCSVVAAIIENKQREVGIAIMDKQKNTLKLAQFADNRHYAYSLLALDQSDASTILFPHSHSS